MRDRRSVDDLSLEELERLVVIRRREERRKRLRNKNISRRQQEPEPPPMPPADVKRHDELSFLDRVTRRHLSVDQKSDTEAPSVRDRLLLLIEILALGGLVIAVILFVVDRPGLLAEESSGAVTAGTPQPGSIGPGGSGGESAQVEVLPGRPPPPPEAAGIALPALYADWLNTPGQTQTAQVPLSESEEQQRPVRIVIPSIDVDAPVVRGDDWEALKKGVGHHLASAQPGERGNMVLSAHNDIFGELFRYLNEVETGDEIIVYDGAGRKYNYKVAVKRIVEPTAVDVLEQTNEPIATLITCYPYLVDTERLVVVAELQQ